MNAPCRALLNLVTLALLLVAWSDCEGDGGIPDAEYRIKAAFLYKFTNYVEWPPQAFVQADSPLVIGVVGADDLADRLRQVVLSRNANGHPIIVRKLRSGDSVEGVHMLFIGHAADARIPDILASTRGQAVLPVTESGDALASGSVINFVIVDDKVRFDIALRPAEVRKLRISALLLSVARKVVANSS